LTVVTIYGRPGCHLCEEARAELEAMRPELPAFDLHEVDIEGDDELLKRLLERIPVIEIDGEVVCDLHLDPSRIRARMSTLTT
jgi:glutaredoxin